ncbi:hypothetical protein BJV78DRAFT_1157361 [Lactifluus subvellereus]|nr:hypothetical protein BJV78DRAFT_1157361 [Lactifluus subvellereus]
MIGSRSNSIALFQGTDQNWFGNARRLHAAGPADRHPLSPPAPADTPHATFGSRTLMPLTAKILPAMSPSPPWNDVIIAESVVASHLVPVLRKRTIPLLDATELSPPHGHHGTEIASIDVKTGHIACFGDGNGVPGGPRAVRWSVRGDCDELKQRLQWCCGGSSAQIRGTSLLTEALDMAVCLDLPSLMYNALAYGNCGGSHGHSTRINYRRFEIKGLDNGRKSTSNSCLRNLVWGRSGHIDCFGNGNGVPGGHALSYSGICYGAVLLALEPDEPQGFCAGVVPRRDCEHQRQDWPHQLLWRQQRRTRGPCAGHILIRYGAVLLDPEPDEPQGFCTSVVPVVGARGSAQALCLRLVLKARACLRLCTRLRRSCG